MSRGGGPNRLAAALTSTASGKLHYFVTQPHFGCGNCFRPCMREGDKWRSLTKNEVPQTSAPTAGKWIQARKAAAGASS